MVKIHKFDEHFMVQEEKSGLFMNDAITREYVGKDDYDELRAMCDELVKTVKAYDFAYTPDGHSEPHDCFSTGPFHGDYRDILCPGCVAENMKNKVLAQYEAMTTDEDAEDKW